MEITDTTPCCWSCNKGNFTEFEFDLIVVGNCVDVRNNNAEITFNNICEFYEGH